LLLSNLTVVAAFKASSNGAWKFLLSETSLLVVYVYTYITILVGTKSK
jgi:hypothetical protein